MGLYRVTLAYDGTDFQGWQAQASGARTVQGVLEEALGRLGDGGRVPVTGASRTDAGVHALGQVASFDLGRAMPPEDLARALNGLMPEDVRVVDCRSAPPSFHPRKSAASKLYRYLLDTGPVRLPQRRRIAGHVPWHLDEPRVRAAAAAYVGRHDFASLASSGGSAPAAAANSAIHSSALVSGISTSSIRGATVKRFSTNCCDAVWNTSEVQPPPNIRPISPSRSWRTGMMPKAEVPRIWFRVLDR